MNEVPLAPDEAPDDAGSDGASQPREWVEPDIYPDHVAACDLLGDGVCAERCIPIFTTLLPEAAQRAYECFMEADWLSSSSLGCDSCAYRRCMAKAFEGPPMREPDPRCSGRLVAVFDGKPPLAELFRNECVDRGRYMNDVGRDRYLSCQVHAARTGLSQWWCLWDPAIDPCGEVVEMKRRGEGVRRDRDVVDLDAVE